MLVGIRLPINTSLLLLTELKIQQRSHSNVTNYRYSPSSPALLIQIYREDVHENDNWRLTSIHKMSRKQSEKPNEKPTIIRRFPTVV